MNRLFILGLGLMLSSIAFQAKAQVPANDQTGFGIRAGVNLMNMHSVTFGLQDYNTNAEVGFQVGVYGDLAIARNVTFLPEIYYIQKNAKFQETASSKVNMKFSYLEVPVLIGYKPVPDLTLFVGPEVSFLLSQKTTLSTNGVQVSDDTSLKNYRKFIAGGAAGLGYSITPNINVNARYSIDFQKALTEGALNFKNKGFLLSLGYTF
ncbi:MAG: porin family protein [Candidatus Pedobacter colombiensis]|uniref:Porin family protein n=1 Tax=Candidatus Pedobacter colombiensis TaxID=3121371 RepID=A0AAJ6B5R2_9SPHI|nr:porin family protein [Pedobacter sp.]WEK18079.1 MAG: porin family protein [Pedobacter sp.]